MLFFLIVSFFYRNLLNSKVKMLEYGVCWWGNAARILLSSHVDADWRCQWRRQLWLRRHARSNNGRRRNSDRLWKLWKFDRQILVGIWWRHRQNDVWALHEWSLIGCSGGCAITTDLCRVKSTRKGLVENVYLCTIFWINNRNWKNHHLLWWRWRRWWRNLFCCLGRRSCNS